MIQNEGKEKLILVPCHSIWKQCLATTNEENLGQLPEHWYLAPFQLEGKDHLAFIKHAIFGVKELLADLDSSILLFSGGQTKEHAGPVSEAYSYYALVLKLLSWVEEGKRLPAELDSNVEISKVCYEIVHTVQEKYNLTIRSLFTQHISTEIFALDSFENLLFSIGRFHELCLIYPTSITIVGFGFKKKRYIDYHAKAIDYPPGQITYVAKDPTPEYTEASDLENYFNKLCELENRNALRLFNCDWYGRKGELYVKKESRNPFKRKYNYSLPLKHLQDIGFSTDDDEKYFIGSIKGKMPWSSISTNI